MKAQKPLVDKLILELIVFGYISFSIVAALLISDDLDQIKEISVGYIGIPLAVLYYASKWIAPKWEYHKFRLYCWLLAAIVVSFSPSFITLVNVMTTPSSETIKRFQAKQSHLAVIHVKRGGLGLLYHRRF